ncbi:hypothetical protein NDU88_008054 [Pleurodeles waltl]|uniref:Uncharacterized protein n=1 Tax=Pleurodeles waltl TaxID=8319 RepID=A0AAV7PV61_PLEWA|nr:hypothetical protein NDU88_008054 [Pleurodeles waltl]
MSSDCPGTTGVAPKILATPWLRWAGRWCGGPEVGRLMEEPAAWRRDAVRGGACLARRRPGRPPTTRAALVAGESAPLHVGTRLRPWSWQHVTGKQCRAERPADQRHASSRAARLSR